MIPAANPNMAIFFSDNEYLENFINYISDRGTGFICSGFSNSQSLKDFAEKNDIAILLTDEACFMKDARYINSEITVVLTESPENKISENVFEVNILQPVDEIIREILQAAAKTDISVEQSRLLSDAKIYSFFSPVGRSLKTSLAIATAQLMAEKEKTIYVNLEPYSGFSVLSDQYHGTDLSDLMFYLRDSSESKASLILQSTLYCSEGVSYIPPVVNPNDLFQIKSGEIKKLFGLLQGGGYKNIIVDMGPLLPDFETILADSRIVFMPIRKDAVSSAKAAQFFSYIRTLENMELEEKIMTIEPPFFKDLPLPAGSFRGTVLSKYMAGILNERH